MQILCDNHSLGQVPHLFPSLNIIRAEVVFGTPSKQCSGSGICMVAMAPLVRTPIRCPHAPVRILKMPGEGLVFLFAKKHINTDALLAYFTTSDFLVEEAFSLPQRLIRMWELPIGRIPPGRYFLEEYSREWRLYFPLG